MLFTNGLAYFYILFYLLHFTSQDLILTLYVNILPITVSVIKVNEVYCSNFDFFKYPY